MNADITFFTLIYSLKSFNFIVFYTLEIERETKRYITETDMRVTFS